MKKAKTIVAIIMSVLLSVLLIVLTSCGKNILKKAYEEIITEYPSAVLCFEISDDGSFISVDTNPYDIDDYSVSGAFSAIPAFHEKLGLSDYIWEEMLHTSALDGRQTDGNGKIEVSRKYHPDSGLEAIYKLIG